METCLPLTEDITCLLGDGCRPFSSGSQEEGDLIFIATSSPTPDLKARLALMSIRWQRPLALSGEHCWLSCVVLTLGATLIGEAGTSKKLACWRAGQCPS